MAGTGPLLWLLAAQILRAGGKIDAILDTTPRGNWLRALLHLPDFVLSPYFAKGLKLLREVRAKVPVIRRRSPRGRGRRQAARGRLRLRRRRATPAGRSPAAASGRRAQRQSRDRGRRRASLERAPALLPAGARRGFQQLGARHRRGGRRRGHRRRHGGGRARPHRRHRRGACAQARGDGARSAGRAATPAARGDGPRLPRLAQPAGRTLPPTRGRHHRLPLRGGDGQAGARHGGAGLRGAEPDEGLPALRHGAVPGPAVRPHRHRADRRGSAARRRPRSATTACARR